MATTYSSMPQHQESERTIKVIVIGAGFSGLAVAYQLLAQNRRNEKHGGKQNKDTKSQTRIHWEVQILEARHRLGGRVHSACLDGGGVDTNNTRIDLGGQWVHEASRENPIRNLMEELEIPFHRPPKKRKRGPGRKQAMVCDEQGQEISKATMQSARKFYNGALYGHRREGQVDINTSFQDLLDRALASSSSRTAFKDETFCQVLNYLSHGTACFEGGRLHELSVQLDDLYGDLGGPDELPEGGYGRILDAVVQKIGMERVRLGCIVEKIDYEPGSSSKALNLLPTVTIRIKSTNSNGTTHEVLESHYCICTVPLGVLQNRAIGFAPDLPQTRWTAIDAIGMGVLNKIVLKFDHRFWPEDHDVFGVAHSNPARVKNFLDCSSQAGAPILMAFLGGDAARRVDGIDGGLIDEDAVGEAMGSLRLMFGDTIADPVAFKVTRWYTDPFAFGSYSFTKVGCSEDAYDEVAAPIGNLLFAGEHTSKTSHSTVHGAWATGLREANRLLAIIADL